MHHFLLESALMKKLLPTLYFSLSLLFFLNFIVFINLYHSLSIGGQIEKGDDYFVAYVAKGSSADISGVQIGDKIITIEEKRVEYKDFYSFVGDNISDTLDLELERSGEKLMLTLDNIPNPELNGAESGIIVTNKFIKKQSTGEITSEHLSTLFQNDDRPYFNPLLKRNMVPASTIIVRRSLFFGLAFLFFVLGVRKLKKT